MSLLKELGEQYKNKHKQMKEDVLSICQNKEYPLAERWELARQNTWAFKQDCFSVDWPNKFFKKGTICWFSDFYKDRYAVVDLFDLIEEEYTEEECKNLGFEFKESKVWNDLEGLKEEILQRGVGSFVNDW